MCDSQVEEIIINFSDRSVTILSDEGELKRVEWKWDREGAEGFAETIAGIEAVTEAEIRTYQFSFLENE
tara:strand:+ start:159 stop:365 length:207 start_codon:yes stop_codon:yes gene_type:complete